MNLDKSTDARFFAELSARVAAPSAPAGPEAMAAARKVYFAGGETSPADLGDGSN